jgi:hypothetical protein
MRNGRSPLSPEPLCASTRSFRPGTPASLVKTTEEVGPTGLNDVLGAPMSDVSQPAVTTWSSKAIVPDALPPRTQAQARARNATPRRSSAYWTKVLAGQDFSGLE